MTQLICEGCQQRIRVSKEAFDERFERTQYGWVQRAWHHVCNPFTVRMVVEQK